MTYKDVCTTLAAHYSGFTDEVVANMTPYQSQVYINAIYAQQGDGAESVPQKQMTNADFVEQARLLGLPTPKNY